VFGGLMLHKLKTKKAADKVNKAAEKAAEKAAKDDHQQYVKGGSLNPTPRGSVV
jgi:hypothetical protein